tara:strand:- start:276 stop:452 length:177 start_codon:yes stop_codon:yes gene_type:complete
MYVPECQEDVASLKAYKDRRRSLEEVIVKLARELAKITEELDYLDQQEQIRRNTDAID